MRLCKDCKHFAPYKSGDAAAVREFSKCLAFVEIPEHRNPVDGADIPARFQYADLARRSPTMCGADATKFESKT
jgi:hypothetical protein